MRLSTNEEKLDLMLLSSIILGLTGLTGTSAYQWSQVGGGRLRTNFWPPDVIPGNVDAVSTPLDVMERQNLTEPLGTVTTSLGSLPFPVTSIGVSSSSSR